MSVYDRIDRELERQIDEVEEDFQTGRITREERARQIRDLQREARAELRDYESGSVGGEW